MKRFLILFCWVGFLVSCNASKTRYAGQIKKQSHGQIKAQKNKIAKNNKRQSPKNTAHKGTAVFDQSPRNTPSADYNLHAEPAEVGEVSVVSNKAKAVVEYAKTFLGTGYRYGGMSSNGIDCSGLVYLSFLNAADIELSRRSRDIASEGIHVNKNQIRMGDLVFFKTNGSRSINHLGIIVENGKNGPRFIHSSTSRGVMISGLSESYWQKSYEGARRIL